RRLRHGLEVLALQARLARRVDQRLRLVVGHAAVGPTDRRKRDEDVFAQLHWLLSSPQRTRIAVPFSKLVGYAAIHPGGKCGLVHWKIQRASMGARFTHPWLRTRPKSRCQNAPCSATDLLKYMTHGTSSIE